LVASTHKLRRIVVGATKEFYCTDIVSERVELVSVQIKVPFLSAGGRPIGLLWEGHRVEVLESDVLKFSHERPELRCAVIKQLECGVAMNPQLGKCMPFGRSIQQLHEESIVGLVKEPFKYWNRALELKALALSWCPYGIDHTCNKSS
jgi:hypothetical protein